MALCAVGLALGLAGCSASGGDGQRVSGPAALCGSVSKQTSVAGDGQAKLVRSAATTVGDLNSWLGQRADNGGPSIKVSDYSTLNTSSDSAAVTVCLFQLSVPRPVPQLPGSHAKANGVRVFVQSSDQFAVDGIGAVAQLNSEMDLLSPSPTTSS